MNLGIAEAFTPVYFYTEIPYTSKGEIFINYKRGGIYAIANVINKEKNDSNGNIEQYNQLTNNFVYDYYNKKINNIKCSNQNGCFLYVGIYVYDIFKLMMLQIFLFFLDILIIIIEIMF